MLNFQENSKKIIKFQENVKFSKKTSIFKKILNFKENLEFSMNFQENLKFSSKYLLFKKIARKSFIFKKMLKILRKS